MLKFPQKNCAAGFEFSRRFCNGVFNVYIIARFSVLDFSAVSFSSPIRATPKLSECLMGYCKKKNPYPPVEDILF